MVVVGILQFSLLVCSTLSVIELLFHSLYDDQNVRNEGYVMDIYFIRVINKGLNSNHSLNRARGG